MILKKDQARKVPHREYKVLLLGPNLAGKTTVFRHIQLLFGDDKLDNRTLRRIKYGIYRDMCFWMQKLIENYPLREELDSERDVQRLMAIDIDRHLHEMSSSEWFETMESISALWTRNPVLRDAKELMVLDSPMMDGIEYFWEQISNSSERALSRLDYLPTTEDILRARDPTCAVHELQIELNKHRFVEPPNRLFNNDNDDNNDDPHRNLHQPVVKTFWRFLDVSGSRSERRKWIHCTENVSAVLFCVDLSGYNRYSESINVMKFTLEMFQEVVHCKWFKGVTVVLLLNKYDKLKKEIQERRNDPSCCFPDYTGGLDVEKVITNAYKLIHLLFH